ncbi:glycine/betaine ABC transporter substrate-binding protein [Ruminococcus sp. CLA-AA-H200]|uniref:Glycine/betaine ABC transporter substrate-binding protein n=1 Tax=Ruminococcus turbiniformis TaxID=2881258 RepID=A0ABS8FV80_9FIRM|nr:glycine betaine ABC transporter substrate-binding protein [Ruminococcus turbiniformis]MCC2253883.1 glycine/betaine ABC transporter substrate-binding protein [Ruminococcus turbiniformis]
MKRRQITALLLTFALVLGMAGCAGSGENTGTGEDSAQSGEDGAADEPVKIATKPMTEQFILGEMLKKLIEENAGYEVELTKGIGGGTSNIQPAMEQGEFDLYPEYTSSGWILVLGHETGDMSAEEMLTQLQKEYEENYGMTWIGLYGQNNTYAVVVREDTAEEYGLETCSDLAEVSGELTFGGNPDYIERADGLPGLSEAYGFEFKDIRDIDIGLKYEALRNGDIDVTNGYTTDAQISRDDVKVLEDDKNYQVDYYCSTVVRQDALEKYPKLQETLELMNGILTDEAMAELNYQVEEEGRGEAEVAEEFLISAGLIEG